MWIEFYPTVEVILEYQFEFYAGKLNLQLDFDAIQCMKVTFLSYISMFFLKVTCILLHQCKLSVGYLRVYNGI